jgi:hypothetical protein
MRTIARDEMAHAALAWQIAHWAEASLSSDERRRVEAARRAAVDVLAADVTRGASERVMRDLGWPRPEEAARMFEALRVELFDDSWS